MSAPISLSDSQMTAVLHAAQPLEPVDRAPFLERLAVLLRDSPEIGDGQLGRMLHQLQAEFLRPPSDTETGPGPPQQLRKLSTAKATG